MAAPSHPIKRITTIKAPYLRQCNGSGLIALERAFPLPLPPALVLGFHLFALFKLPPPWLCGVEKEDTCDASQTSDLLVVVIDAQEQPSQGPLILGEAS
jgi:hypothetical protein